MQALDELLLDSLSRDRVISPSPYDPHPAPGRRRATLRPLQNVGRTLPRPRPVRHNIGPSAATGHPIDAPVEQLAPPGRLPSVGP